MKQFEYKEFDLEGRETLDVVAQADKFNIWMYQTIKPYCSGKILEIGSGIGNVSQYYLKDNSDISLSDIRSNYCDVLRAKFKGSEVIQLDLTHPDFDQYFARYLGQFETVFALNVVEHIQDHTNAILNCYKLLKPGGKLIILVPAYQKLYNRFDEELEHFRRYTKGSLNELLLKCQFEIFHSKYFNFVGIFGWYISGRLLKRKTIPAGQMSLYNRLVPFFKIFDIALMNSVGLSVISIGIKK